MELKCVNKKCQHIWEYKGKITDEKQLISCPKCHYRNPLGRLKPLTHSQEILKNDYKILKIDNSLITHSLTEEKEIEDEPVEEEKPEKVFDNISDFNMQVLKDKFENQESTEDEEWKEMPVEISDPREINGEKIVMKKYRDLGQKISVAVYSGFVPAGVQKALLEKEKEFNDPFLNAPKIDSGLVIRQIHFDINAHIDHMKNYG